MKKGRVVLRSVKQRSLTLPVRIAETAAQRRGGFQNTCPDSIKNWSILFVFDENVTAEFHMRRVTEALDIAFIDADGWILDIQRMEPLWMTKSDRRYRTTEPFRYALETYAGKLSRITFDPSQWHLSEFSIDTQ